MPVSYIHLQEVVSLLAQNLKQQHLDPVLNVDQYKWVVVVGVEKSGEDVVRVG